MADKSKVPAQKSRFCVACGEPIDAKASLCSKCGSHQQSWKNHATFLATIAGAIALVFAAAAYIIATIPIVRRTFAWRSDLRVVALESARGVTVLNAGDGPVLLSHIWIRVDSVGRAPLLINRVVDRAQALRHDWITDDTSYGHWELLGRAPERNWAQAVAAAELGLRDVHRKCYGAVVYSLNDPGYLNFDEAHKHNLRYVPATATLYYNDLRRGEGRIEVPVRALIFYEESCRRQQQAPERDLGELPGPRAH